MGQIHLSPKAREKKNLRLSINDDNNWLLASKSDCQRHVARREILRACVAM
jgi:hypothetical protein